MENSHQRLATEIVAAVALPFFFLDPSYPVPSITIHEAVYQIVQSRWSSNLIARLESTITQHIEKSQAVIDIKDTYDLTCDEVGAIVYYTTDLKPFGGKSEDSLFRFVNKSLATRDIPDEMLPYLYYILRGLKKLPSVQLEVFRALDSPLTKLSTQYKIGNNVVWPAFTSTTKDKSLLSNFSNKGLKGTWMIIEVLDGRDISSFSIFPESEVLLLPNSEFVVSDILSDKIKTLTNISENVDVMVLTQTKSTEDILASVQLQSTHKIKSPALTLEELWKKETIDSMIGDRNIISTHPHTPALQFIYEMIANGRRSIVVHHACQEPMGFVEIIDVFLLVMQKIEENIKKFGKFDFSQLEATLADYDVTHMIGGFSNSVMITLPCDTSLREISEAIVSNHVHRIIAKRNNTQGSVYLPVSQIDLLAHLNQQLINPASDYWINLKEKPLKAFLEKANIALSSEDKIEGSLSVLDGLRKIYNSSNDKKPRQAICIVDDKGLFIGWLSVAAFLKMFSESLTQLNDSIMKYLESHGNVKNPVSVTENTTFGVLLDLFLARKLHRVYVVDRFKRPTYVITSTLIIRWLIL